MQLAFGYFVSKENLTLESVDGQGGVLFLRDSVLLYKINTLLGKLPGEPWISFFS